MMEQKVIDYLREEYKTWGWIGQRAHDGSAINSVLPLDFIISCDFGRETEHYFSQKIFSLEKVSRIRKNWSNEDINESLEGITGVHIKEYFSRIPGKVHCICYRSFPQLELLGAEKPEKLSIISSPVTLKETLDDKIFFREILHQIGIELVPGNVIELGSTPFEAIVESLGIPFVIQFPRGSSGNNTFIIRDKEHYSYLGDTYKGRWVNLLTYISGIDCNINVVIYPDKNGCSVLPSFPSVQLIGLNECSNSPTTFCGNDFSAMTDIDESLLNTIYALSYQIGTYIASLGFKGIFGIDMILEDEKVYPIEINPRFQNSTGLFTALELLYKKDPQLILYHLASFFSEDKELFALMERIDGAHLKEKIEGAQVILHNSDYRTVVTGAMLPGVYLYHEGSLLYKHPGALLTDCTAKDDILITCGVPEKGLVLEPGSPVCKIQTRSQMYDCRNKSLIPSMREVIKKVYQELQLTKCFEHEFV
ncbi:ATP-grasp domain-containing protein [Chlamydiota bacterium]